MIIKKKKKLTKNEENSLQSGLIIGNAIKISYSKNSSIANIFLLLVIAFLGLFGTIFSFITLFNIEVNTTSIVLYTLVFFMIFSIISILPDKFLFTIFPILLIYIYIFQDYMEEFILGFKIVSNYIANTVFDAGVWTKYYPVPSGIVEYEYATLFLVFCIFMLTGLICLFTIKIQSCVMSFALTFPFIECGIYFGAVPNYLAFFMVICYWIAILSMALSGCKKTTKNKSAGFVRVGNSFFAKSDCNFRVSEKIGISSILMCLVCALLSIGLVNLSGYERSEKINTIRSDVKQAVEDFTWENASYTLSRLSSMFTSGNNGTFNGTLGQNDKIEYEYKEKCNLTSTEKPKSSIYLKNYVGSKYTGNSWDKLNNKDYKVKVFDEFKTNNIYPQDLLGIQGSSIYENYNITISTVSKNSRAYLIPYATYSNNGLSYIYDTNIKVDNSQKYSLNVINMPIEDIFKTPYYPEVDNFDNTAYREFVDKYYLQLDNEQSMEGIEEIFQSYLNEYNLDLDTFKSKADLYTKLNYIRNFLCSQYEYTLSPGKTPINEDFVLYFLKDSKKGYCSHFASAGAILCRMLNIPSRYVEGFYIDVSEFNSNTYDGNSYNITIKDNVAHAWVEIFIDNIGWVNFEFTPGFNGNPTMANFQNQQNDIPPNVSDIPNTEFEETQPQQIDTQVANVTDTPNDITTSPDNINEETTTENNYSKEKHELLINGKTLKMIKHILMILITLSLTIGIIILRRKYIIQKRTENISSKDNKKSILTSYRYIMQILKYLGFERKEAIPYIKFAQEVSLSLESAKNFPKIMELILKAELSNLEISNEEKSTVADFAYRLINVTYEEKSKIDKLIIKYILCLI